MMTSLFRRLFGFTPQQRSNRHSERREEPPVRPLPLQRPGQLSSLSLATPQLQSLFITQIPPELRLLIWEYVLTLTGIVHLKVARGTLRYHPCKDSRDILGFRHRCWWNDSKPTRTELLSVLLSCRLMYSEAVDVLYRVNTFDFNQLEGIIRLPQVLLPSRLEHIRRVHLSVPYARDYPMPQIRPDEAANWARVGEILGSLPALDELRIEIANWPYDPWRTGIPNESLIAMLSPLTTLRVRSFEVVTTCYNYPEVLPCLEPVPFRVTRIGGPNSAFDP